MLTLNTPRKREKSHRRRVNEQRQSNLARLRTADRHGNFLRDHHDHHLDREDLDDEIHVRGARHGRRDGRKWPVVVRCQGHPY